VKAQSTIERELGSKRRHIILLNVVSRKTDPMVVSKA
jgi:hypothetical protein